VVFTGTSHFTHDIVRLSSYVFRPTETEDKVRVTWSVSFDI